jgi:3-methyladenine DNA glycosylase AlkD
MPTIKKPATEKVDAATILKDLEKLSSKKIRDEMAPRYGVHTDKAFGVSMANMKAIAKRIGVNHELAAALWKTGWYEARMVASMIDDVELVTPAQMDRWARDFDNWGICDTACFVLFDRSPHAFDKVVQWSAKREEFVKRAAFALLACLALHRKDIDDKEFIRCLPLIEKAATDERNFVKKGASWALRAIGRRNPALNVASVKLAKRLADSSDPTARWLGKEALRDISKN